MTTSTTARRATAFAALALSAPLILAACGGSDDAAGVPGGDSSGAPPEAVYEFVQPTYASAGGALDVQIPEALKEVAGSDFDELWVSGMTLTPHELESADSCAVDLEVSFADGGKVAAETAGETEDEHVAAAQESFDGELQNGLHMIGYASWDDMVAEKGVEESVEMMNQVVPVTAEGTLDEDAVRASFDEGTPRGRTLQALGLPGDSDIDLELDKLDPSNPETGVYASDDASQITIVQACASSTSDEDATEFDLEFPRTDEDEKSGVDDAASFTFTVMRSGEIGIVDGEVDGYQADANGDWITS
ncbi:hypothetical protein GCM10023160_05830 [Brachybacterium paraconglomeratum]|uniref:hypothetical protein n=1 Tax=Brachybacterium paraconglomeratum TaxID=173362 RepID=UPI0031EF15EE